MKGEGRELMTETLGWGKGYQDTWAVLEIHKLPPGRLP